MRTSFIVVLLLGAFLDQSYGQYSLPHINESGKAAAPAEKIESSPMQQSTNVDDRLRQIIDFLKVHCSSWSPVEIRSYGRNKEGREWTQNSFEGGPNGWIFRETVYGSFFDKPTENELKDVMYTYISQASFKELDSNVLVEDNAVTIFCGQPNCISYTKALNQSAAAQILKYVFGNTDGHGTASRQTYSFPDAATANRIAKAIAAAIELNGGKASPF